MTTYFVSRHDGAHRWARILQKRGWLPQNIDVYVEHLDPGPLRRGDVVIGTLPLAQIAQLRRRGVTFWNLDLNVPPQLRGRELTATQMASLGATLTDYRVIAKETFEIAAARPQRAKADRIQPPATVMLVSKELMPQYLGYLHLPTPTVRLVVTKEMQERAKDLERLLQSAPNPPETTNKFPIQDAVGYDGLRRQADDFLDALLEKRPESLTVNLTGGTKLMSMAFHDAARAARRSGEDVRTIYVDTAHGRIELLDDSAAAPKPLFGAVDVAAAVLASGKPDGGCASASAIFQRHMQRGALHAKLLAQPAQIIGLLNSMAVAAGTEPKRKKGAASPFESRGGVRRDGLQQIRPGMIAGPKLNFDTLGAALCGDLGEAMAEHGVFREPPRQDADGSLIVLWRAPSEIDYVKGGWLEAQVAAILAAAGPDDWAAGVQIGKRKDTGRNNELDAIATCGNRTLLIEVKTANLTREQGQDDGSSSSKGQDTLYKLDSVGHALARHFNRNWLVSARQLSKVDLERAKDRQIEVFAPLANEPATRALGDFEKRLGDWVREGGQRAERMDGAFRSLPVSSQWAEREAEDRLGFQAAAVGGGRN